MAPDGQTFADHDYQRRQETIVSDEVLALRRENAALRERWARLREWIEARAEKVSPPLGCQDSHKLIEPLTLTFVGIEMDRLAAAEDGKP